MSLGANHQDHNPLIPLTSTGDGVQAVMGRDLHEFLEVKAHYKDWFPRMVEYGFIAGQDFSSKMSESTGGRPKQDHIISLDMAKQIAMIQRTDKGRQAREYFLECERKAKQPALTGRELLAHAVLEAQSVIESQAKAIEELAPAAKSWENLAAPGGDFSVAQAAKVLSRDPVIEIGRNRLFDYLAELKWIFKTKGKRAHWEAYQPRIESGLLSHKLGGRFINEETGEWEQSNPTVRITAKGLHELHKRLGGESPMLLAV